MTTPHQDERSIEEIVAQRLEGRVFTVGADVDYEVLGKLWELSLELPTSFTKMMRYLRTKETYAVYEVAHAFTSALVYERIDELIEDAPDELFDWSDLELSDAIYLRLVRRYAKDPTYKDRARSLAKRLELREVALPLRDGEPWDTSGWWRGARATNIFRHPTGLRRQSQMGVPPLENIHELRELLEISSPKQLGFLLLASDQTTLKPYHTFTIPKRRGGERLIAAPNEQLRTVQQHILHKILAPVEVHDAAHGFVTGRSTLTNAAPHVGKAVLFKFDLNDFFGTVGYWRVVGLFASLGYPVGELNFTSKDEGIEVATTLARLCCYTDRPMQTRLSYTPQGAPTSPAISNLICRGLDHRLHSLAQKLGGAYTRYADDLTFSFDETPSKGVGRFRWWVNQICQQEGFVVREDKFRVIRASQQQRVTGIVVNDKLSVPRRDRRRFRAILHNCERDGIAAQARGRQGFEDYLMGYAAYLNMVHPEDGAELVERVKALLASGGGDE